MPNPFMEFYLLAYFKTFGKRAKFVITYHADAPHYSLIDKTADYFRSLGQYVDSKEEFEKKAGPDMKILGDFIGFLKKRKAEKEAPVKTNNKTTVNIVKDPSTGKEIMDLGDASTW